MFLTKQRLFDGRIPIKQTMTEVNKACMVLFTEKENEGDFLFVSF